MSHPHSHTDDYRLPPDIISSINYIDRERRDINTEDTDYNRHIPLLIVIFFAVLLVLIGLAAITNGFLTILPSLWGGLGPFYLAYHIKKQKKQNADLQEYHDIYVRDVVVPLLESLNSQFRYDRHGSILPHCAEVLTQHLTLEPIRKAEDLVEGEQDNVSVRFGEVEKLADEEYEKFICFVADFNKQLSATTLLAPKQVSSVWRGFRVKRKMAKSLKAIQLDNPTFNKKYRVYTDSDIEARYVLTPGFMENIVKDNENLYGYYLFKDNKMIFLGSIFVNNQQMDLFDIHADTDIYEQTLQTAKALRQLLGIVKVFNLNSRIWK